MNVSILVPAHNEAANIENLLESLLAQEEKRDKRAEILVLSSTDLRVAWRPLVPTKPLRSNDAKQDGEA